MGGIQSSLSKVNPITDMSSGKKVNVINKEDNKVQNLTELHEHSIKIRTDLNKVNLQLMKGVVGF